jgi:hypothetical protein
MRVYSFSKKTIFVALFSLLAVSLFVFFPKTVFGEYVCPCIIEKEGALPEKINIEAKNETDAIAKCTVSYKGKIADEGCKEKTTDEAKTKPDSAPKAPQDAAKTAPTSGETTIDMSKFQVDCAAKAGTERGILTKNLSLECVGCGECGQCDILMVVKNIVQFILQIAGPLAILGIILGGFLYITSGGSQERAQEAKGAITAAVIGLVIILVAWVLVNFVIQILTDGSQNIFDAAWYQPKCK